MPALWTAEGSGWTPVPIPTPVAVLSPGGLGPDAGGGPRLVAGPSQWVLLAKPADRLLVNGERLTLGIRVLRDRDELGLAAAGDSQPVARFYYSTEQLARVEPFPGGDKPVHCPRCKQPLEVGRPAVRCPSSPCQLWHHEDPDNGLNCWSFAQHCALCEQPTPLDAGYRWTPDGI